MQTEWTTCLLLTVLALLAAAPNAAEERPPQALPLKHVVLFSSGVGYFQREGRIQGPVTVPLSFRAEQVNDILKSLVVLDPAGQVRPATYTAKETVSRRLGPAGRVLDASVSLGALLRRFQGARLRLDLGAESAEGRLLSVHTKSVPAPGRDGGVLQVDVINLVTEEGLRSIPLDQVTRLRLLDERLDRELRESLELLGAGLNEERRTVDLQFAGGGAREVRVGYLQEMPVWKTTYRLVLDDREKPYLQGWALVENPTDEDWENVRLSLVSGRPISFIQDLYQPLYIPRPVVAPQIVASPRPQTYGEAVELERQRAAAERDLRAGEAPARARREVPVAPPVGAAGPTPLGGALAGAPLVAGSELGRSVAPQAEGQERGELFEYAVREPVTLPRGKAAMVPILGAAVDGERVSIYDPASDERRALVGFRLRNDTGLHLAGGPITVFRSGAYAGDAQIADVRPGEDRLIAYAVDLELVPDRKAPALRQETVAVSARSGVLHVTRKQQREWLYTFRNKGAAPKTVLVLQRIEPEFRLAEPARPAERTPDEYRFRVTVPAGETALLKVVTERPLAEQLALLDADVNILIAYAQNAQLSQKLRAALKQLVERRRQIADLQARRADLEGEIRAIDQEQSRIRQNMERLDRNSALYQQYVRKLTEQETRIEQLRQEIARLREQEQAAQKELREFVDTLTID